MNRVASLLAGLSVMAVPVSVPAAEAVAAVPESAVRRLSFVADIEVDHSGGVKPGEVRGLTGQLQEVLRGQLVELKLQPARNQHPAQVARSQLSGQLLLTPTSDDKYVVGLDSLRVVPDLHSRVVPSYPPAMIRANNSGAVLLETRIGVDGRVLSARILQASRREFAEPVLAAARQWNFQPQWLAGKPVEVVMQWPVVFKIESCRTTTTCPGAEATVMPAVFVCEWDASLPRVETQSACGEAIEVRGSRVLRGSTQIGIR